MGAVNMQGNLVTSFIKHESFGNNRKVQGFVLSESTFIPKQSGGFTCHISPNVQLSLDRENFHQNRNR